MIDDSKHRISVILWLSMVTILASPSSLLPSREAISLVCEAVPGTKGALRKRKVHEWTEREKGKEGGREWWSDHGWNDAHTKSAEKMNASERYSRQKKRKQHYILYSFTPPLSIYSISSVSAFFSSFLHLKKRKQRQIERGRNDERDRERLYSEKRAAKERGKRWRGMGLYMRGRSSSPRCIAHRAQCLVTHVVHNICDQEAELVCVCLCVSVRVHVVCPQYVRRHSVS